MGCCVFVKKDLTSFVGYDMESKQLVLNAAGWFRWGVVYRVEYEEEKEVRSKLKKLNKLMGSDIFEAVPAYMFLKYKKYDHFRTKGTLNDKKPSCVESEEPYLINEELINIC